MVSVSTQHCLQQLLIYLSEVPMANTKKSPKQAASPSSSISHRKAVGYVSPASSTSPASSRASPSVSRSSAEIQQVLQRSFDKYLQETSKRLKLIDTFLVFLVLLGVLQFVYCILIGNYVCIC